MTKVIVGLSGGVDSAVAALLLQRQGWEVEGLFMKNWEEDDSAGYCAAAEDLADAQAVADRLGIRLSTVNFASEYWDRVFEHFLAEYRAGRTPNPDVLCNREIKFKAFLDHALRLGAERIATGHYARLDEIDGQMHLRTAADSDKDQTYFLHLLDQHQLAPTLFPLGDLTKPEVRKLAEEAGLPNFKKKDSTGICFIGERRFRDFLQRYIPAQPGPMVTPEGDVVGRHQGLMYYTIGQRKGLGIGGQKDAEETPWFVAEKDLLRNRLVVVQGHDHPLLFQPGLIASQVHWIGGEAPPFPLRCQVRLRHRQPLQACEVVDPNLPQVSEPAGGCLVLVRFDRPQRAVAPGQSAVFYLGDECLGGGVIEGGSRPDRS